MQNASFENLKRKNSLKDANILQLPDDRQLCYAEYGDPDGLPIFVFHGNPNSRLLWGVIPGSPFDQVLAVPNSKKV
jgi:hypothetical protein